MIKISFQTIKKTRNFYLAILLSTFIFVPKLVSAMPMDLNEYCSESRATKFYDAYFFATLIYDEDDYINYFSKYTTFCGELDHGRRIYFNMLLSQFSKNVSEKSDAAKNTKIHTLINEIDKVSKFRDPSSEISILNKYLNKNSFSLNGYDIDSKFIKMIILI
jgi:adenine-specific DNA methylase